MTDMMTLGLHALAAAPAWSPALFEPILPGLAAHGVALIEAPLLRPEEMEPAATRALLGRYGMELVCSLGLPRRIDPVERPDEAAAFMETALEATAAAGGTALSGVTYGCIGRTSGAAPTARELDGLARHVARAAKAAAARGLRLGIEPCNRYETHLLNTAAQAAALIERVGADNVFIHLDTYHMNIEERGMAEGFADAGAHLGYVHLSESNRGVPGRGTVDWDGAMRGLAALGYAGPAALESFVFVDADIAAGLAIWRPVAEDPAEVLSVGLPFLRRKAIEAGLSWTR
jgi:D-psicose/D-tagatose/L-ribulose 3-epimerase